MPNQATLVYEADSSQVLKAIGDLGKLNRASEQVAAGADKLSRAQEKQADSSRLLLGARRGVEALHRQDADTLRALTNEFNPLLAAQNRYTEAKARLSDAVQRNIVTEQQAQDQLQRLTAEYARAQVGIQGYADGMQRVNNVQGSVGNQFAQLNDVVVTAWGGMNPALIGMQQGMQVVQGFAGQSLPQALGTLRGAFGQLLSPMTLVTVGVVAGAAALIQWGASALGAEDNTDIFSDAMQRLRDNTDALKSSQDVLAMTMPELFEEYGRYALVIRDVTSAILELQVAEAEAALGDSIKNSSEAVSGFSATMDAAAASAAYLAAENQFLATGSTSALDSLSQAYGDTNSAINNLVSEFGVSRDAAIGLADAFAELSIAGDFESQVAAVQGVNRALRDAGVSAESLPGPIRQMLINAGLAVQQAAKLDAELGRAAESAARVTGAGPKGGWLSGAIGDATALAEALWGAWMAASAIGQTTGSTSWYYGQTAESLLPPVAGLVPTDSGGSGGGSGGGGSGGGGGGGVNQAQAAWDALNAVQYQGVLTNLETLKWGLDQKLISEQEYNKRRAEMLVLEFGLESQQNLVKYNQELSALNTQFEQKLIAEETYLQRRAQLQYDYYSNAVGVEQNATSQTLSNLSSAFSQMNSLAGGGYDELLRAQKTFAAGSALINAYLAATQALADPTVPFLGKLLAYGNVLAAGMGAVNAIKGGGGGGGASTSAPTARSEPTRNILVNLTGLNDRDATLIESIMTQIYEQTRDGRVVIQRDR